MSITEGRAAGATPLDGTTPDAIPIHGQLRASGLLYVERQSDTGQSQITLYDASGNPITTINPLPVAVQGEVDVLPASPAATAYLPVRLTDGVTFYTASGDGGGTSGFDATGFESITVSTTAIGVTAGLLTDATRLVISVEAAQIRYRWDGLNPTATVGHLAEIGDVIVVEGADNVADFRAIRTGATDATLRVTVEEGSAGGGSGGGTSTPATFDDATVNLTTTTATDVLAAPGAGFRWVVTGVLVSNGHASVSTKVSILSAATLKQRGYASALGGGWDKGSGGGSALFAGGEDEAIRAQCGTTGADVDVFVCGYTEGV